MPFESKTYNITDAPSTAPYSLESWMTGTITSTRPSTTEISGGVPLCGTSF